MLNFKLFLLACVLFVGSAYAEVGRWGIDVEFLYLRPSIEDTYFVIDAPASAARPAGTRINNEFDFHPGFRIGGMYRFDQENLNFQAHYTRLSETQNKLVSGPFLWATVGMANFINPVFSNYTGTACSHLDIFYQGVNGFFDQKIACHNGLNLFLQGGFEYAYIRLQEDYRFINSTPVVGDISLNTFSSGIGPQLGLEVDYEIYSLSSLVPGSLSLQASASGSVLTTRTRERVGSVLDGVPNFGAQDLSTWRLISAVHMRLGISNELFFSCSRALFEIGYEYNSYYRAITRIAFLDNQAGASTTIDYSNFDTQGLYFSAEIKF